MNQAYEARVKQAAAALGVWVNAASPPGWADQAARIVLNAAGFGPEDCTCDTCPLAGTTPQTGDQ